MAEDRPGCTITVQPGESIQAAIDAASPGDVICLSPGEWEENLVIEKSLTLRAAEIESEPQAVISSAREGWPVIRIESEEPIDVTIQGLKITGAFGDCYQRRPVPICADGISVHGKATAEIDTNTVNGNRWHGIVLWDSAQATIGNNTISANMDGIVMVDLSQAAIASNIISGNKRDGISMGGFPMWGVPQARITGNVFRDNERYVVALHKWPCFDTDAVFTGYVAGSQNTGGGNAEGDYCPEALDFLFTQEGGELDRRE